MGIKGAPLAGALAAGIGGLSLCVASPAIADQELTGTYNYSVTESLDRGATPDVNAVRTWTFTPCGPGCTHVNISANGLLEGSGGYEADLQLVDGLWQMTVDRPDLAVCTDGRRLPGTVSYSLDPASMTGTANGTIAADCDGAPGGFKESFMLAHYTKPGSPDHA